MIKIAVLGHGVVGSGVVEVMEKNKAAIEKKLQDSLEVKYILDIRSFPDLPYHEKFIKDFSIIEQDPEIKVVAEVMGGVNPAFDFTLRCLRAGKSVVTSNKELVATKGDILLAEARKNKVNYLFEASVGGGIPIIRPMHRCLSANEITEIYGILNGTTNYILTQMMQEHLPFAQALAQAQELGYAERNPAADVEGHDALRKICILAALAFGKHVQPQFAFAEGITDIELTDMRFAQRAGYEIKLIAQARKAPDGRLIVFVSPALVNGQNMLAQVKDVFNAVLIRGNVVGDVLLYGRGAGKLPTASAVVADIIEAAKHDRYLPGFGWESCEENILVPQPEIPARYYLRLQNATMAHVQKVYGAVEFVAQDDEFLAVITPGMTGQAHCDKQEQLEKEGAELVSAIRVLDI